MRLAYALHSRGGWVWVVLLTLVIVVLCILAVIFFSDKSREPFGIDELYGLLD
jgi:hypothetical protein